MAQVPYEHIESPRTIHIDGVRAFNVGDAVPLDTARRLGLLDTEDAPPIIAAHGIASSPQFTDAELKVAAEEAAAAGTTDPASPTGDATTGTPPQAQPRAPRQGPPAVPTP